MNLRVGSTLSGRNRLPFPNTACFPYQTALACRSQKALLYKCEPNTFTNTPCMNADTNALHHRGTEPSAQRNAASTRRGLPTLSCYIRRIVVPSLNIGFGVAATFDAIGDESSDCATGSLGSSVCSQSPLHLPGQHWVATAAASAHFKKSGGHGVGHGLFHPKFG